jgi:hypothetical protein
MLEAALEYASRAWPVLPLRPGSKLPATLSGLHDASTNPDEITAWWSACPTLNVGIATGAAAGVLVVDLDTKHGVDGFASWAQLLDDLGVPLHRTLEVATPSGGLHEYYQCPDGCEIRNSAGRLGPGIDTRACGGYAVAAPSHLVDPDTGEVVGVYEVSDPDVPVAPLPPAVLELMVAPPRPEPGPFDSLRRRARMAGMSTKGYARAALEGEVQRVLGAVNGVRNHTLNRAAFALGTLAGAGVLDAGEVADELVAAADRVGLVAEDGIRAVQATVRSGLAAGMSQPRGVA